jgi:hypothetical protein
VLLFFGAQVKKVFRRIAPLVVWQPPQFAQNKLTDSV